MSISSTPSAGEKFTALKPPSISAQAALVKDILFFFDVRNFQYIAKVLGQDAAIAASPFSLLDFFAWSEKSQHTAHYRRWRPHVFQIVDRLVSAGYLSHEGRKRGGVLNEGNCYWAAAEFTRFQKCGDLRYGKALGPAYISSELPKVLVRITGTVNGVEIVGTGIHVLDKYIVTCDHVLRDMDVHDTVEINGNKAKVARSHLQQVGSDILRGNKQPAVDVAVLELVHPQPVALPDIAFRRPSMLEEILVAGFPTIPHASEGKAVFQTGEICQVDVKDYWQTSAVDLFSAIARPGNSGGPLVTMEGNIVGLVTKSLERQQEALDPMRPFPFFASVRPDDVQDVFKRLTNEDLPWEDYQ